MSTAGQRSDTPFELRGLADVMAREDQSLGWSKWGADIDTCRDAANEIERLETERDDYLALTGEKDHEIERLETIIRRPRDVAAHHLHLNGDPRFDWRFSCDHEPGGHWATYDDPNDPEPASNECWLRSWWDELDMEMLKDAINVWNGVTTVPIPLDVEGDGWGVGPLLVPWKDEADDVER